MALDLFANFERASNNTVFYRLTSDGVGSPRLYTVTLKLSDTSFPDADLSASFYATSSVNGAPRSKFYAGVGSGTFSNYLIMLRWAFAAASHL